jgi:hypothetical protein
MTNENINLMSLLIFYGTPLLVHINARISKGLNSGFDKAFMKLTQFLPWKKSKPKTQQEAQVEIEATLRENPALQSQVDTLLEELKVAQPQLVDIVREYHKEQISHLQYVDNRGATINGGQKNIGQINGNVEIN